MKKVFYFSLGLLFLVLIFLGAYNFVFKNNVNDPTVAIDGKTLTNKEPFTEEKPLSISISPFLNEDVSDVSISLDGFLFYYSLDDQALKKATLEGKDKTVLLSNLPGTPTRILWSPKKDRVLLFLKQSTGESFWYSVDIATKTLIPLKAEISRIAWNNLGDTLLYQYTDFTTGKRTLNTARPDGTAWKKIVDVSRDTYIAPIPQSASISFWSRPNAFEATSFESVGITGESRKTLLSEKFGADYLWSPNGEKVLVSTSSEKGGKGMFLGSMNANGGEFQSLATPTLISKVVWSKDNKTIYFALPGSIPENAVLPNDYFEKSLHTKDTFWKLDMSNGKKTRLTELKEVVQNFDSTNLLLSPDESTLFFTDRVTKRLYRIEL
ncbi:MAG: hypothetical protein PHH40_03860 [Candidatus Moranbacteria bacterium]|nr:hypothetical protein [Candidatus Moranbacteria bacterium]MDD3964625.1 hypothetical protein [Candidatus Moranbacteria bacterium]